MEKRAFKNEMYGAIAGIAKSFANANRLEVLDLLANGEKTVEQIAVQTAISVANASQHLQTLKNARLVKSRREGTYLWYSLNGAQVYAAWQSLRSLALKQDPGARATLQQYRQAAGSTDSILWKNLPDAGPVLLLDVRPRAEYEAGHPPGAQSLPLDELPEHLNELPRDKTIITCCRGPFCTYADEAVQLLRAHGFQALRLEESYLDIQTDQN